MEKESRYIIKALEKLREFIKKFAPQELKSFRTEEAKVKYLYNAVAEYDWAKISLTQCYFHELP